MLHRLFSTRKKKLVLVSPQELAGWIESQVRAHVPRFLIYQQLLEMEHHEPDPIIYRAAAKDVMAVMLIRNHRGTKLELAGQLEAAIAEYEANVGDLYEDRYPYYRLRLIYEQRRDYENAIRVCEAYLRLSGPVAAQHKEVFRIALQQLRLKRG